MIRRLPSIVAAFVLLVLVILFGVHAMRQVQPTRKLLVETLTGADRLLIEQTDFGAAGGKKRDPFELKGAEKFTELLTLIEIDESHPWFHCMCDGDYLLHFYKDDELAGTVGYHHGTGLRWHGGRWEGDVKLTVAAQEALPRWFQKNGFAAFQEARELRLAGDRERARMDARFAAPFPETVRADVLFVDGSFDCEQREREKGRRVGETIGNGVDVAVAVSRAFGTLEGSDAGWLVTGPKERIALAAVRPVSGAEFLAALEQLREDRRALLGAARIFFSEKYLTRIPAEAQPEWTVRLAAITFEDGYDDNKSIVLKYVGHKDHPAIRALLRDVLRGQVGKEIDLKKMWHQEPGLRAGAALVLAVHKDAGIKEEVKKLLTESSAPQDRAALEVSLALLGDPAFIKAEQFSLQSYLIGLCLIKAIERFQGTHGMDVLVEAGLNHPWPGARDEAEEAIQRITGQKWPDGQRRDAIKAWWEEHGEAFVARRRAGH